MIDTEKLFKKAIRVIRKEKLIFAEEVIAYLGVHKSTYYDKFAQNTDYSDTIKDELQRNKVITKVKQRSKWYDSENATLQVALYKICATEDEAHRLNGSKQAVDLTSKNNELKTVINLGMGIKPTE